MKILSTIIGLLLTLSLQADYTITNALQFYETFTGSDGTVPSGWRTNSSTLGKTKFYITNDFLLCDSTLGSGSIYNTNVFNCAQNWRVSFTVTPRNVSGGGFGFFYGERTHVESYTLFCAATNTGKLGFWSGPSSSVTVNRSSVRTNVFPILSDDILDCTAERYQGTISWKVKNRTTGLINTLLLHNTTQGLAGKFTNSYPTKSGWLGFYVQTPLVCELDDYKFDILFPDPTTTLFLVDSTGMYNANSEQHAWPTQTGRALSGSFTVFGCPGDETSHHLLSWDQIAAIHPAQVIIALGLNNASQGHNAQAYLDFVEMWDRFTNMGTKVIFCSPTASNDRDPGPIARFLGNTFPENFVDSYALTKTPDGINLWGPYVFPGDATHPNQLCHDAIASALIGSLITKGWAFK